VLLEAPQRDTDAGAVVLRARTAFATLRAFFVAKGRQQNAYPIR